MNKRYHTSVTYGAGQYPYQHTVVYRVEEAFQVKAHAVFITLGDIFLRSLQGLVAASVRAEAKAVVAELPFIDRTQDLADGLLDYSVHHRRDTKRTFLPLSFGISTRRTGFGRYLPDFKDSMSSSLCSFR